MQGIVNQKKRMTSQRKKQLMFIWGWLALPIRSWLIFFLYVNISSVLQAFQDVTGKWSLDNFKFFWNSVTGTNGDSGTLKIALKNTLFFFTIDFFVKFPFQLMVAYFLYKKIFGYKIYRYIFYFPVIISNVAMTGVFKEIISPLGVLGELCREWGIALPKEGLLSNSETVVQTVAVYGIWDSLGAMMLILCGAMVRIPTETLESGRLDGVGAFREFFQLILPMIWSTLSTMMLLKLTGILTASGEIMLLVGDTASFSLKAHTLSHWIFSKVYASGNHMGGQYGQVSAAGLSFTLIVAPFILFVKWLFTEKIPKVEF